MDCENCMHYRKNRKEDPCCYCKNSAVPGTVKYTISSIYWEPNPEIEYEAEKDMVNRPPHYTQGGIECIDAMKSAFGTDELAVYCKIAAFKYIWRCEHKNGLEDVKKAVWYLNKYLELKDGEQQ